MESYRCDWRNGFIMNPTEAKTIGYLVFFQGLNMDDRLHQDVEVFTPYNNSETTYGDVTIDKESGKATVVGVIEQFNFGGGVGDSINISAYISAENAEILSAKMKTTLETTVIKKFAWWICAFDAETKVWYEAAYPKEPTTVMGQINAAGGKVDLTVSAKPTKVADNVDVNVYKIDFSIIPAANSTYTLHFATSSKTKFIRNWGLKVGTNAAAAVGS